MRIERYLSLYLLSLFLSLSLLSLSLSLCLLSLLLPTRFPLVSALARFKENRNSNTSRLVDISMSHHNGVSLSLCVHLSTAYITSPAYVFQLHTVHPPPRKRTPHLFRAQVNLSKGLGGSACACARVCECVSHVYMIAFAYAD